MLFFKCHFNSVLNMYAYPHMYVLFDCKQEQREWFRSDFVLNIRYVTTVSGLKLTFSQIHKFLLCP